MNKILLFSGLMLLLSSGSIAQTDYGCKIRFSYDNAGNRILREYKCINIGDEEDPPTNWWVQPRVFPNPTTGPVVVQFDIMVSSAQVTVTSMSGQILNTVSCQSCYELNINLSSYPDATYLLSLVATRPEEENFEQGYTIIKITE